MDEYILLNKILSKINVKQSFDVAQYLLRNNKYMQIIKKMSIDLIQIGGKRINFNYHNKNIIFYKHTDNNRYIYKIHVNDNEEENECIIIIISSEDKIAYIENISYHTKCINGLNIKGGGTLLLKIAIKFIKQIKLKYNIDKIQLKDNAFKFCKKNKQTIRLSLLSILTSGDTWYGKHGFIPFDSENNKIDKQGCKFYAENKKIINSLIVKNTNIKQHIINAINELNIKLPKNFNDFFQNYDNMPLSTYLYNFMQNFDKNCNIFGLFYIELAKDLKIFDFHGSSFFMLI